MAVLVDDAYARKAAPAEGNAASAAGSMVEGADAEDLAHAVAATLAAEGCPHGRVTLVVTSDEAVAELNRRYRSEGVTDVLAFPAGEPTPGFVGAPEMTDYLGDILIAFPFTQRQAARAGQPLRDELRLLAVHGVLHLLGHDHAEPAGEAAMWARQEAILAELSSDVT